MTLDRRLDNLEESLSPREVIICWLREVHEFESYASYCRWLLDQPDDAYPLIKLTSQVRAGVRSNHKGTPGVLLKDELRRAEKEVIFLYYVQKELNLRLYMEEEVLRVWAYLLTQKLRLIVQGKAVRDDLHLEGGGRLEGGSVELPLAGGEFKDVIAQGGKFGGGDRRFCLKWHGLRRSGGKRAWGASSNGRRGSSSRQPRLLGRRRSAVRSSGGTGSTCAAQRIVHDRTRIQLFADCRSG